MCKKWKSVIAALTCTMMLQSTAMAAPLDELNEIMTNQQSLQTESLMSQTLGLEELGKAITENGINVSLTGGLMDGTAAMLGMEDEIPQDAYVNLGFKLNLALQRWLLEAGFGAKGASIGDLTLYGDSEKLSLSIPQIFAGAVSLYEGNLKEQYTGSALEMMIGQEYPAYMPDLDLKFYPDPEDLELLKSSTAVFGEGLEGQIQAIEEQMQVEKIEEEGGINYQVTCDMDVILDVYSGILDTYLQILSMAGTVDTEDLSELEEVFDQIPNMMQDELQMNFHVKDNLLQKIDYEIYMDTSAMSDEADDMYEDDELYEADEFKGYVSYEIIYQDPSQPLAAMDLYMTMLDEERSELMAMTGQLRSETEGAVSELTYTLDMSAEGESLYSGQIYGQTFNAETGEFDAVVSISDGADETVAVRLDSTFADIEAGKSFTWNLDGLTVEAEGESIGVQGQVKVSAEPEEIQQPQEERVVLELNQEEMTTLLMEIMQNGSAWAAQFEPEDAYDEFDEYEDYEDLDDYEDEFDLDEDYSGADDDDDDDMDEASAVSIIGGADGPTSVFVAGKVS